MQIIVEEAWWKLFSVIPVELTTYGFTGGEFDWNDGEIISDRADVDANVDVNVEYLLVRMINK